MRKVSYSGQFKKDLKLAEKRGKDINKLKEIILLISARKTTTCSIEESSINRKLEASSRSSYRT